MGQKSLGVLLGILGERVRLSSPNPDLISDQKLSFSTPFFRPGLSNSYPFSDLEVVTKRNIKLGFHKKEIMSLLLRLKPQQKDYLKSISNSHIDTFFLIHFELKRRTHWYTTVVLRKSYPIPDQNGQNLDPFSDQNGVKVKPFGAAHTYMAGIWEYCTVLPGQKFLHGWLISEEFQKRVESRLNHLWGNIGRGPFKYESHGGR